MSVLRSGMPGKKNESLENKEMEPHASCVQVQHFKDVFMETPVYFLLISLRDSFFVWVGSAPPCLDHMAVAVPTRFVRISAAPPPPGRRVAPIYNESSIVALLLDSEGSSAHHEHSPGHPNTRQRSARLHALRGEAPRCVPIPPSSPAASLVHEPPPSGKKIGKMFFVSCSLYEYSMELQVFVERRIREALASSA